MIFIVVILFFLLVLGLFIVSLKRLNKTANTFEISIATLYILSLFLFALGMFTHSNPYYEAIDPVDGECYSPFSEKHILTLFFYFFSFNFSVFLIWIKKTLLPPLTLTLSLIFILIGIVISFVIIYQISTHDTSTIDIYSDGRNNDRFLFFFAPFFSILIGVLLLFEVIRFEISATENRTYPNKLLNTLNNFLDKKSKNPIWILFLMFPVFIIATLLLILFGQDANSMVKVFTDTATWKLSQQIHPPILDHKGHYLCTVAASGNPKIVKPIRIGKRNEMPIIVNRQLLIANAFEEMIQNFSPKTHHFIRKNYDKYGYNISTKINTTQGSNITYIVMKPLEWLFLLSLYLFCNNPEQKIKKQYAA